MRFESAAPVRRRIGLTPLIDVVFLLLMFFMLASTFGSYFDLSLKSAAGPARQPVSDRPPVLIRLHSEGRIDVNAEPVDMEELRQYLLTNEGRFSKNAVVQVRDGARTQDVVNLLAALRRADVSNTILTR